jgi:hypothetical protein
VSVNEAQDWLQTIASDRQVRNVIQAMIEIARFGNDLQVRYTGCNIHSELMRVNDSGEVRASLLSSLRLAQQIRIL